MATAILLAAIGGGLIFTSFLAQIGLAQDEVNGQKLSSWLFAWILLGIGVFCIGFAGEIGLQYV